MDVWLPFQVYSHPASKGSHKCLLPGQSLSLSHFSRWVFSFPVRHHTVFSELQREDRRGLGARQPTHHVHCLYYQPISWCLSFPSKKKTCKSQPMHTSPPHALLSQVLLPAFRAPGMLPCCSVGKSFGLCSRRFFVGHRISAFEIRRWSGWRRRGAV